MENLSEIISYTSFAILFIAINAALIGLIIQSNRDFKRIDKELRARAKNRREEYEAF
jgi:hypothetical protein